MKREVPLVLGAIFISALADIMAVNFVWSKYQKDVVKFTGFKNGIYFKPETMEIMRSTAKLQNKISLNQYQLKDGEDEDEDEKIETAVNSQGEDADKSSASLR